MSTAIAVVGQRPKIKRALQPLTYYLLQLTFTIAALEIAIVGLNGLNEIES